MSDIDVKRRRKGNLPDLKELSAQREAAIIDSCRRRLDFNGRWVDQVS